MRAAVAVAQTADLATFALASALSPVPGGEYNAFAVFLYESTGLLGIALAKVAAILVIVVLLTRYPANQFARFVGGWVLAWGAAAAFINLWAVAVLS